VKAPEKVIVAKFYRLPGKRIARVLFYVSSKDMVLLHGFIKKSQATPQKDLKLANRRMKEHERNG